MHYNLITFNQKFICVFTVLKIIVKKVYQKINNNHFKIDVFTVCIKN